jgi:hypothetical protein
MQSQFTPGSPTRSSDGSFLRQSGGGGSAAAASSLLHRPDATPYNSRPDGWALTLNGIHPNTSCGLKRMRHAKVCGLAPPGGSDGSARHYEFTDRQVWPEYVPEASAAVARHWTGTTLDGYLESAEPADVRRRGWAQGVQDATVGGTPTRTGGVRGAKLPPSVHSWWRRERSASSSSSSSAAQRGARGDGISALIPGRHDRGTARSEAMVCQMPTPTAPPAAIDLLTPHPCTLPAASRGVPRAGHPRR